MLEVLEASLLRRNHYKERQVNHDFDWMAGTWTAKEANAFDKALAEQRSIDPDVWK